MYVDERIQADDVSIVFELSHTVLYAAFYEHGSGAPPGSESALIRQHHTVVSAALALVLGSSLLVSPRAAAAPATAASPSAPSPPAPAPLPTPLSQPASRPRPELFDIPPTFDLPVFAPAARAAPVARPPRQAAIVPSEDASVIAAPAGFTRLPTSVPANPGALFVVTSKWVKVVGPHVHVVLVGRTSSPIFSRLGTDITAYVPLLVSGLRGQNANFSLVASRRQPLCNRRDGYLIQYVDRSVDPLTASVVFVIAGETAWTAIYEHDLKSSDLPAGVASIDSLCPPLAARGR